MSTEQLNNYLIIKYTGEAHPRYYSPSRDQMVFASELTDQELEMWYTRRKQVALEVLIFGGDCAVWNEVDHMEELRQ